MRIGIIGSGAIGSALGSLLNRDGHDVVLIGRSDHVEAIRLHGLRVDGCLGEFTVRLEAAESFDLRPDLALLSVKTQDVTAALREHRSFLVGVPLVTLQNGVRADELAAEVLPRSQIISAVVAGLTVNYLTPGQVTLVQRGSLVIGRPFGRRDADTDEIARILNSALPTLASDNIQGSHWTKLILNLNNALPALINRPIPQVARDQFLARLAVGLMREGLHVARLEGIPLEHLPGTPLAMFRLIERLPLGVAAHIFSARVRRMEPGWPMMGSTLQSILRGRTTEIDYLNGEIVRVGNRVGKPVPLNARVVELVHRVECTGQFLTEAEVHQATDEVMQKAA